MGVNVAERAVTRICNSEHSCRKLLSNIDKGIQKKSRGSYHSHGSQKDDISEIVLKLMEKDALTMKIGSTEISQFLRETHLAVFF